MGHHHLVPREVSRHQRRLPCGAPAEDIAWRNRMAILDARGGGLDVHAKTVVACLCIEGEPQSRTCATMTEELWPLADGLLAAGCPHVALERTGVYWRPGFHVLEEPCPVVRVNAHHIKAVPGRKTDVRDGDGLGDLLRHGLLRASCIPPRPIRALRAVTRHRPLGGRDRASVAHRIQTLLASAHRTRGHVAPHVLGLSGRCMLPALADGEAEAAPLAPLAQGKLKAKTAPLQPSLTGHLPSTPRFLLQEL